MNTNERIEYETRQCIAGSVYETKLSSSDGKMLIRYMWLWSCLLLIAVPFACFFSGEGLGVFDDYRLILISPSKLITDYFNIGGLGAALLNAAVCGFFCNFAVLITRTKPSATLLAGYFLVIAHCFYGLNLLNMIPPFLGIVLFCIVSKRKIGEQLHIAMFATSLAPFISDFLFRYTLGDAFEFGKAKVTVAGVALAAVFGLLSGFLIPAILPGTTKMHRGYNLYKAGLAIGLFGMFAYALFYINFGIDTPDALVRDNRIYAEHGNSYIIFMDIFFFVVFAGTLLLGFIFNGKSFKGYGKLWKCDGLQDDFPLKFGTPLTFINIGFYGLCVLAYLNIAILTTSGVGFTGPTAGVTIAAITFSAAGQTPKNVWPIAFGYMLLFGISAGIFALIGLPAVWSISTQAHINGLAFAAGLCPFSGRYGRRVGIIAGMLDAVLCASTSAMHGGFVLYNGGLTAGLTAMLLLPILDFYNVKPKENSDG